MKTKKLSEITNGIMSASLPTITVLDEYCPICNKNIKIYMDIYTHPNSMFSIRSCNHINLSGYSCESDILEAYHDWKDRVLK